MRVLANYPYCVIHFPILDHYANLTVREQRFQIVGRWLTAKNNPPVTDYDTPPPRNKKAGVPSN